MASPFSPLPKDLFGLAIVPLLRGHIANSAMIALGVIDKDKFLNNHLELIKTHIVLVLEPVVLENPKPGLDPAIVRGSPVAGKELFDAKVSEKLLRTLLGHLDTMIREGCGHLRGPCYIQKPFIAEGLVPGLLHGLHRGVEAQVPTHNLAAENIYDGK